MKKLFLTLVAVCTLIIAKAQTTNPGPAEIKLSNALCECLNKVDKTKITDAATAKQAFVNCFLQQMDLAPDVAKERNIEITDKDAIRKLGEDVGIYLLKEKCSGFLDIAAKMAQSKSDDEEEESKVSTGTFKRVDNKGFNYIVISSEGKEKSFLWFKQFAGSEAFMTSTAGLVGKKLKVSWVDTEAYLPAAKGYYQVKEITAIEILK